MNFLRPTDGKRPTPTSVLKTGYNLKRSDVRSANTYPFCNTKKQSSTCYGTHLYRYVDFCELGQLFKLSSLGQ